MENIAPEPIATPVLSTVEALPAIRSIRHDGWTGEKMAIFCETLAESAVVAEACDAAGMGISGAYAARRRSIVFAAAWDAALTIARERLADTLLARAMEGNVDQIWRDGEVVGERHAIDNRLGLALLRRLDRLAETGLSISSRGTRAPTAPAPDPRPLDWDLMVDALRTGDDEGVAGALALLKGHKVEEVEGPPDSLSRDDEDVTIDLSDRYWRDEADNIWMTDFPPPPDFTGYQSGDYDEDFDYKRVCSPEEIAILDANAAAARAADRAEDEELRDGWLAMLKEQVSDSPEEDFEAAD